MHKSNSACITGLYYPKTDLFRVTWTL